MPEKVEKTPSGLLVVRDEESASADYVANQPQTKPKKERPVRNVVRTDWLFPKHKLSPEDRKQRREDNKAMKEIRKKTRGRKRHGRVR